MFPIRFFVFLTLFALCGINASAQRQLVGQVVDADSGAPIPYVSIGIRGTESGTIADGGGHFAIQVDDQSATLDLSAIGYQSKALAASSWKSGETIALTPLAYQLNAVTVEAGRFDGPERLFGAKNENGRGPAIALGSPQLGAQIGSTIQFDRPTLIKRAGFVLNHAKGDSLLFRLNIYRMEGEEVGEQLLTENILVREKQRRGTFEIELAEYDLVLEGEVLFALEWLRDFDELGSKGITFDLAKTKRKFAGVYMTNSTTRPLRKMPVRAKYKPCFYLMGKQAL
ncbi:carboxypeptidase-like regulatory domain-containing protein [Lewinella sp. W8]|uniref:carboxypeptidase-like regulatory domain-containing protein n=1 Tax=Lewinella sp. W8 TaxID=2528208 RepID=UPI0010681FF1|nr:carboxypeptidase-like regulatory domain-containing protein [Lewinella sp. W8]MTB52211.1 hypothetical protein [Lewinella sp. W8]